MTQPRSHWPWRPGRLSPMLHHWPKSSTTGGKSTREVAPPGQSPWRPWTRCLSSHRAEPSRLAVGCCGRAVQMDVRSCRAGAAEFDHAVGSRLSQVLGEIDAQLAQGAVVQLLLGVGHAVGFLESASVCETLAALEL